MNQTNGKAWVEALRSNDYTQTTGCLQSTDHKFCCLGVAADLAVKAGVQAAPSLSKDETSLDYLSASDGRIVTEGYLPVNVQKWLELDTNDPEVNYADDTICLSTLNDSCKATFQEIADLIELTFLKSSEA